MPGKRLTCAIVAILLCLAACGLGAEGVLSDNDIGHSKDMTQTGRWRPPAREGQDTLEGERTFRVFPGGRSLSRVRVAAWWPAGEAPPEDVVVAVTFKDTAAQPVTVAGWTGAGGIYGYPILGRIGGSADAAWKTQYLVCPRSQVRRHPDGEWRGHWSLLFNKGEPIAVDRIQVLAKTEHVQAEAIRQARAARAASIENLKKRFKHIPRTEPTPLGDVSETSKRLRFIPYARSTTEDVYPGSIPRPKERGARPLKAFATPGEFEPIQVAAFALERLAITAAITDLTGPGTLKAGRDVAIHWIESTAMRHGGGSRARSWQTKPVWLRPNEPRTLEPRTSQAWYITTHVPADARPGLYRGEIALRAAAGRAAFPIELRVLPFTLDTADHVARGAYTADVVSEEHIAEMAAHGLNSASIWRRIEPRLVDGKCVVGLSPAMDDYLRKLKKAGFVRAVHFGGGDPAAGDPAGLASATKAAVGTPRFSQYYGQFWKDIRRLERENGWPEMICCPFDEPVKSNAKTRNYLACYNAVKHVTPQTKVFCVFMNRPWACTRLGTQADIWSCNGAFAANQAEKQRLAAQGTHKLFYTYTGCMANYRPGPTRFNAGFLPWHHHADGTYFWAYLWTAGDPFNDLDGDHLDWSPVARDVDGKLYRSLSWEAFREGVDDRRYVETCLRIAREKKRQDVLDKLAALQSAIAPGKETEVSRTTQGLDYFFFEVDNASTLDAWRAQVVALILDMLGVEE